MSKPAILYSDIPKVNYWHSTAPTAESIGAAAGECDVDYDDENDEVMETIFSDPCMDYVMVPSGVSFDDDSIAVIDGGGGDYDSPIQVFLKRCNTFIFSPKQWWLRTSPEESFSSPSLLGSSRSTWHGMRGGSTIYSSYDWVSEVVMDDEGRRLILPGQLVVLDSDHPSKKQQQQHESCMDSDELPLQQNTDYASLLFGSSTIMVSAHDLLATRRNVDDGGMFSSEAPPLYSTTTTATNTSTLSKALWKLASRKIQSAQNTLHHTGTVLVKSLTRQFVQVEERWHIFSTTSDIFLMALFTIASEASTEELEQEEDATATSTSTSTTTTTTTTTAYRGKKRRRKLWKDGYDYEQQQQQQEPAVMLEMAKIDNRQQGGDYATTTATWRQNSCGSSKEG